MNHPYHSAAGVICHRSLSVSTRIWSAWTCAKSPLSYSSPTGVVLSLAALADDFYHLPVEGGERKRRMMKGGWKQAGWKAKSMICVLWVTVSEWKCSVMWCIFKSLEICNFSLTRREKGRGKELLEVQTAKIKGKVSDRCFVCVCVCSEGR